MIINVHGGHSLKCRGASGLLDEVNEDRAVKNIERLFGQYDAGAILKATVHSVAICAVDSVTVNVENGVKGELKLSNSTLVVKKTVTETDTLEA